jgi:hypothetical protein
MKRRFISATNSFVSIGFDRYPSKPSRRKRSFSPCNARAVIAITRWWQEDI